MHNTTFVPGPLHPDLFDGETPMLLPMPVQPGCYEVEVCWTVTRVECAVYRIHAESETEAAERALRHATALNDDGEEFEVTNIQESRA